VALGPLPPRERPRPLYEAIIRPNQTRIVWYDMRRQLPDISPQPRTNSRRPPRANSPARRTLVAGIKDDARRQQMIWMPEPPTIHTDPVPSPNLIAISSRPKPLAREFTPPPKDRPSEAPRQLPAAPAINPSMVTDSRIVPAPVRPVRDFRAPDIQPPRPNEAPQQLPAAPAISPMAVAEARITPAPARLVRDFRPPDAQPPPVSTPAPKSLPAAPDLAAAVNPDRGADHVLPAPARPIREFRAEVLPNAPAQNTLTGLPDAPGLEQGTEPQQPSMAIVSLNPSSSPVPPKPTGSMDAGFSAGPRLRQEGGNLAPERSILTVPGLLARGNSPETKSTLVAAIAPPASATQLRAIAREIRTDPPHVPDGRPAQVASDPDGRLGGRNVYTVAIQMPNITSYTGSWIVWFAERESAPGSVNMRAPVPLRKVDPKYFQEAIGDRVEGKVRLAAVIRSDGRVDSVALVQHLDERLDRSAEEALAKWEFEPALRNGVAVDVDAIFEIPFRLAPKLAR
jgi:TonB family protein